uniref:Class II aldolase/adducin N-terminal domain-containing protein n=1 Tax=Sinocyclocheilus grahami TaxID=75366 RepID=A0A672RAD2_SINGR
ISSSLMSGVVSTSFKHAILHTLLKKTNLVHTVYNNFRPISKMPFISKILEKEELDVLIQEQMKKEGSSSNMWALRQIADFMATHGSPASLPITQSTVTMVTPINDLHGCEPGSMVKGERLMRCKLASVHRLVDLYGWAQLANTCLTMRVSKEQEHFLVLPDGLAYGEVTASSLVKVNILGEVVEKGSTTLGVDLSAFSLHSAIYSARPDVRCLLHLHTPAIAAVSAMKCGLLPLSHEALLVGEVAYYDYNGVMEAEEDRVELQKSLGPTCKVLVLRNHGIVALGESVEEAFYTIYHIQTACQIQVAALCSAGGEQNLIMLDRNIHRPVATGTVGWAGSTFGPMHKSRLGEHEFEALMRTLDNLGYRTGYAYRFPVLLERSRTRREVEVPATVTSFSFHEDGVQPHPRLHPHAQRQQQKTRWLNTPNVYQKVSQDQASPGHRTTWQKAEEITQGSGLAIKIENPNQFVPLFTNPQEVLETRNKVHCFCSIPNHLDKCLTAFSFLFSFHYFYCTISFPFSFKLHLYTDGKITDAVQNDKGDEKKQQEELEKQMKALSTTDTSETTPSAPPNKPAGNTPEGSPSKSPLKKKKKFKAPCFLKKSKKQKEKAES